ncbi:MAG: helix-turn-helix transcriptional regulator [Planctomycetes bacterium]|nr:helix-turn-helix transcriptional regulator [Planctomycetota bacterium]
MPASTDTPRDLSLSPTDLPHLLIQQLQASQEGKGFLRHLLECSDDVRKVALEMLGVLNDPSLTPAEKQRAGMTLADALFPRSDECGEYGMDLQASESGAASRFPALANEVQKMKSQEAAFAERLSKLMHAKCISQTELAKLIGCSQPAISQMLNRKCRPQKRTIFKLASAMNVSASELWPDIELSSMLDAISAAQVDDTPMSEAEAKALDENAPRNRPTARPQTLPKRTR